MRRPSVSICIPTYCQTNYLAKTLASIKEQLYDDYELIISDDSPDNSVFDLVSTFNFGDRLRYHKNKIKLGSPKNWNEAVRHAKGAYIKLMHHDDRFSNPNALGEFVELLDNRDGSDFGFSASIAEDAVTFRRTFNQPTFSKLRRIANNPELLFFGNIIGAPSATIYRNGSGNIFDARFKWLVDVDFYFRNIYKNKNFSYTKNSLVITTSNANHQVTSICKDNLSVEIIERLVLYKDIKSLRGESLSNLHEAWFKIFEKYKIYNRNHIKHIEIADDSLELLLCELIAEYQKKWTSRLPNRLFTVCKEKMRYLYYTVRN